MNFQKCTWNDIYTYESIEGSHMLGIIMGVMLFSGALYVIIILFIGKIKFHGPFIKTRKWFFLFSKKKSNREGSMLRAMRDAFIAPNAGVVTIEIRRLSDFLINNVSMKMYQNEITVILGHEDSGASLLASIVVGLKKPEQGTVLINGYNVHSHFSELRHTIGYYNPQMTLFPFLTMKEHILLCSRLRHLTIYQAHHQVQKYMFSLGLQEVIDKRISKLSPEMKLKMLICVALSGNTSIIILNDPFRNASPKVTYEIMQFLTTEKLGRTIFISTNSAYVAETIGDRVGIMCNGRLSCYANPMLLLQNLGAGYNVICVKDKGCVTRRVTGLFKKYIPNISAGSGTYDEVIYTISEDYYTIMPELLSDLENNIRTLKLKDYNVYFASLDEVFLNLVADGNRTFNLKQKKSIIPKGPRTEFYNVPFLEEHNDVIKGRRPTIKKQCHAMLYKNSLYLYNHMFRYILTNLIVTLFLYIINYLQFMPVDTLMPMPISLAEYPKGVVVLETHGIQSKIRSDFIRNYLDYVHSFGNQYLTKTTRGYKMEQHLLRKIKKKPQVVRKFYLAGMTIDQKRITCWYNQEFLHTAPLSLSLMLNGFLKAVAGKDKEILITNYPQPYKVKTLIESYKAKNFIVDLVLLITIFVLTTSSTIIFFVMNENTSQSKLLQYINGLNFWIYWFSHIIMDLLLFLFVPFIINLILGLVYESIMFPLENSFVSFGIVAAFAIYFIPFLYFCAYHIKEPNMALITIIILTFIVGVLELLFQSFSTFLIKAFNMIPFYSLYWAILNYMHKLHIEKICIREQLDCATEPLCCDNLYSWNSQGIFVELTSMLLSGFIFFNLVVFLDNGFINEAVLWLRDVHIKRKHPKCNIEIDDTVFEEEERVLNMTADERSEQKIVLLNISKYLKKKFVIYGVTIAIKELECFGIIGLANSGKTALLNIMSGDLKHTYGEVYIDNVKANAFNIVKVYNEIDYCSQRDALFEEFTGFQNLKIHFLLNGVPSKEIKNLCNELVNAFFLSDIIDKKVKYYNNMHKRIMRIAIGCIGNKPITLMDDPASHTDPTTKMMLWKLINVLKASGSTIVLVSNNMTDCEMCCTRFAIMVNGFVKFIGTKQQLMEITENCFIVGIKLNDERVFRSDSRAYITYGKQSIFVENVETKLKQFIHNNFPGANLISKVDEFYKFLIPLGRRRKSEVFEIIQNNADEYFIDSYFITEKSLQTILIEMSR